MAPLYLLLTAALLCVANAQVDTTRPSKNGVCTSSECTILAGEILKDMKPEVDPCSDFFSYTCGGWVDRVPIPDYKSSVGYFSSVKSQNQEVIRSIVSADADSIRGANDATKRNQVKLMALYGSCIDETKITQVGVQPLVGLVQDLITAFPAPLNVLESINRDSVPALHKVNEDMGKNEVLSMPKPQGVQRILTQGDSENYDGRVKAKGRKPLNFIDPRIPQQQIPSHVDSFVPRYFVKRQQNPISAPGQKNIDPFVKAEKEALANAITQLAWIGVTGLVEFDVDSDPKNPNVNVFRMGESGLGLSSKEYYNDDMIVQVYQTTVEEMFTLVMGKVLPATNSVERQVWAQVAKNVVDFEKLLADISSNPDDLDNSEITYNPRTLAQIAELVPSIDWTLVVEKLSTKGTHIQDPIIVSSPEYLAKLDTLLQETPALTLQNYFVWKLISQLAVNLDGETRQPMMRLKAALQGTSSHIVTPRWETCVDVVDAALGAMAGHFFIQQAFKGDSKEGAESIISSLRTAFVDGLAHLDWLDHETLVNAKEKVEYLIQKVGFSVESPDVRSSEGLEEYFKDLEVEPTDFFGNQIRARRWNMKNVMSQLSKPVDKAKWLMSPQTVNAYYNPSGNEMVFPAGILQPPFFHTDSPEYLNYGGVGVVAGHELTHAFDDEGRRYDATGKFSDWWTGSTLQEFKAKTQCFVDQYGGFTVEDPQGHENQVNGKLTLGENLADNGGLKTAFEAWQTRFDSDPQGEKFKNHLLAGLEQFSREQLFYVAFARVWCSHRRPASAIEALRTDPHSPAKWRVNGAVQNSKHFAEVFKCAAGAPMNPKTKCDLW
ncbi:hypothetical protein BG006_005193 [Podila minutissima]|uniref:Endothelin-converting enzyme 1 n=1 Tax=Podila minutissima TaxID=64525 RepID=A0A9P5VM84_9FUNG|nr:hypothetical protein BG006_005193 [Podila minutissima]